MKIKSVTIYIGNSRRKYQVDIDNIFKICESTESGYIIYYNNGETDYINKQMPCIVRRYSKDENKNKYI